MIGYPIQIMSTWRPIELDDLRADIRTSEAKMDLPIRRLWKFIQIEPIKWHQHPWGDQGGGFWVVGLFGQKVLWYNDIEDGFNISRYTKIGTIDNYLCDQQDLRDAVYSLWMYLESGEIAGGFGPPQPINRSNSPTPRTPKHDPSTPPSSPE